MTIDLGLSRILFALAQHDNPHLNFPVIHVAGTNGKGSVVTLLSKAFESLGLLVGTFQTPHLREPRDSISINGVPASAHDFSGLMKTLDTCLTPFEALTATALLYFNQFRVDVAVIEVGMGGKLDATNVFTADNKLISVLTSIGKDHQEFLGTTIESITEHKAGIIIPDVPAVVGTQKDQYLNKVYSVTQRICPSIIKVDAYDFGVPIKDVRSRGICFKEAYQTSLVCLDVLKKKYSNVPANDPYYRIKKLISTIDILETSNMLSETIIFGRLQWCVFKDRQILVDGAHNIEGIQALKQFLIENNIRTKSVIFGVSKSKNYEEMLDILLDEDDFVCSVSFSKPKDMPWVANVDQQRLVEAIEKKCRGKSCGSLKEALAECMRRNEVIVICGSLYLVSDFFRECQ